LIYGRVCNLGSVTEGTKTRIKNEGIAYKNYNKRINSYIRRRGY